MTQYKSWEGYGVRVVREQPELPFPKPSIIYADDVRNLLQRQLAFEDKEIFCTVIMDSRGQLLGINTVAVGTISTSIVHPREVFRPAILMGASSIILAHNHPSGIPTPSEDDLKLTRQFRKAGKILGIEVLDHFIIAENKFISLKEKGLL